VKLLTHFLAADVRRFRLLIVGWLAVAIASTVAEGMRPMFVREEFGLNPMGLAFDLIWLAKVLLGFVLIPLVVQIHPLVGSDAFWMTRPISGRLLLWSKLILLSGLIIVVPVVCELVLMTTYAVPPKAMAAVAVQSALSQAGYLATVMALAALTRNLAGFALLCGGALLAFAVALMVSATIAMSNMDEGAAVGVLMVSVGGPTSFSDPTQGMVFGLLAIGATLVFLLVQYRTRSPRRSVLAAIVGLAAAWTIASVWPWPLLRVRFMAPTWATDESTLKLTADPESVDFDTENPWGGRKQSWRIGYGKVRLAGIQHGWVPTVQITGARLDLDSGVLFASRGFQSAVPVPVDKVDDSPLRTVVRAVLDVDRLVILDPQEQERVVVALLRESDFTLYAPARAVYHGRAAVELTHEEAVAWLPLQVGATFKDGSYRLVVDQVRTASRSLGIRARTSHAWTAFDRRPIPSYTFYLRNQRRDEAVSGSADPLQQAWLLPGFFGGMHYDYGGTGFAAFEQFIRFPAGYGVTNYRPDVMVDAAWLADAELVVVRATAAGSVPRPLEIRDFPLRTKQGQR
jgi:hypothetical protein